MKSTRVLTLVFSWFILVISSGPIADEAGGLKIIYVVTDDQKLYAWEGNELKFEYDIVSGRPGKETHPGVFSIFRKHEDYRSRAYDVEMPYTMFFTEDGKALHATTFAVLRSYIHAYVTESVGSMGCVRDATRRGEGFVRVGSNGDPRRHPRRGARGRCVRVALLH